MILGIYTMQRSCDIKYPFYITHLITRCVSKAKEAYLFSSYNLALGYQ